MRSSMCITCRTNAFPLTCRSRPLPSRSKSQCAQAFNFGAHQRDYCILVYGIHFPSMPPSTTIEVPVTKSLAGLAKNRMDPLRSCGVPHLLAGVLPRTNDSYSLFSRIAAVNGVLIYLLAAVSLKSVLDCKPRKNRLPWTDTVDLYTLLREFIAEGFGHL